MFARTLAAALLLSPGLALAQEPCSKAASARAPAATGTPAPAPGRRCGTRDQQGLGNSEGRRGGHRGDGYGYGYGDGGGWVRQHKPSKAEKWDTPVDQLPDWSAEKDWAAREQQQEEARAQGRR